MNIRQYTVKASSELMKLLSSGIYSNKILAVVRELTANALDVTQESGDVQLEIKTIKNKHFFIVRDTGPGLAADETVKLMSTYGNTTKSDQDAADGMFGIGSKSPFAYTREFYIRSIKNGEAHYFKCYKDDNNYPFIEHLKSEATDIHSGLEYRVPIEDKDVAEFIGIATGIVVSQFADTRIKLTLDIRIKNTDLAPNISRREQKIVLVAYTVKPRAEKITEYIIPRFKLKKEIYNTYEQIAYGIKDDPSNNYYYTGEFRDNAVYKTFDSTSEDVTAKIGSMYYRIALNDVSDCYKAIGSNFIYIFQPSELLVTGSRESIEETPANMKKLHSRINQALEYINNLVDKNSFFVDLLDSDTPLRDFIKKTAYTIGTDKYAWGPFLKKELDKKFFYSAGIKESGLFRAQFYVNETYRQYEHSNNQSHMTSYILIEKKTKNVFCEFPRNGIEMSKIKELGDNIYFIKDKDLTTLLQHKQFKSYLLSMKSFSDDVVFLTAEDRKQYVKTKKNNSASVRSIPHASMHLYAVNENKIKDIKELENDKKIIYFYYFRGELHIARNNDLDPDFDPHIYSLFRAFDNYLLRPLTINKAAKYQLVVFSTKQEALKYFKKNKIQFNLVDYSTAVAQEAINNNKFVKHLYYFLSLADNKYSSPLKSEKNDMLEKNSHWYSVLKSFLLDGSRENCEEADFIIDKTKRLIDRTDVEYSIFEYTDIDEKYLEKIKHFARFMYAIDILISKYSLSSVKQTIYMNLFNLYKKIYIDSDLAEDVKTEINIFEPIFKRRLDDS